MHSLHRRAFVRRERLSVWRLVVGLVALAPITVFPPSVRALPMGGTVVAGNVDIGQAGGAMTLTQASRNAIVNWQSFGLGTSEQLRLLQPGADAAMLARVVGGGASELLGTLKADGKLFLINPHGIVVGPGAVIDTAAFLASTLDVSDADFLAGRALTFKGDSDAGIVNLGKIQAREGNVLLFAHTVKNAGEIAAPQGTAGLGAGTEVYLAAPDDATFTVKLNLPQSKAAIGVDNSGVIAAAQAELKAAGGSVYDLAVNHSGVIDATGVKHLPDGRVVLTADGGTVSVSGSVRASEANGAGGEILVGGDYQGGNPGVPNAARTAIGSTAKLDASASSPIGDGGRVIVWADDATRYHGSLTARGGTAGGNGGFAEVSGRHTLNFAGTADLSAPAGEPGTLLFDADNLTIVAGTTDPLPDGLETQPFTWQANDDAGDHTLGADSIENLLLLSNVTLRASNSLTVASPIIVPAGGQADVELSLGAPTVQLDASVDLSAVDSGKVSLFGRFGSTFGSAAGATLSADEVYVGGFPIVALDGPVVTERLTYDMIDAATSFRANNASNAISRVVIAGDDGTVKPVEFSGNVDVRSSSPMQVAAVIGSANNVTFSAAGDLILASEAFPDPAAAITASGTVKLAATDGGVFVNEAGAAALNGTARRVIYTSDTNGSFTLGGLAGYTQIDGVAFPNDPNAELMLVVYRAAGGESEPELIPMTITANDFIKRYGDPDPTFTASYSGGTSSDLTALPQFKIAEGAHVNVGTYSIVPFGAASNTHEISYENGTLRIDPVTLTYVANQATRIYGDANPAFGGTVTGFVNGDTLESATTGTLAFDSTATTVSNAGTHEILGSGLTANHGNYVFEQAIDNYSALEIQRAPLTVTFHDITRVYGDPNPVLDATFAGFKNGDTAAVLENFAPGTTASIASPVGTYPIGSDGSATNYALTIVPGALTVTPAPLTLMGGTISTVYGTAADLSYTVTGFRFNEPPSLLTGVSFDRTFVYNASVGTYTFGFSNPGMAPNYTVTKIQPGSYTVTPASLTLAGMALTSVYGDPPPPLGYTVSGLIPGDSPSVLKGVSFDTAFFSNVSPGTYVYGFSNHGTAENYVVTKVGSGSLMVTRRPLTVTAPRLTSLVGAIPPNLTPDVTGGIVSGGPSFTTTSLAPVPFNGRTPPGSYVLTPTVTPTGGASLADIERYYDITFVDGQLTLSAEKVDGIALQQTVDPGVEQTLTFERDNTSSVNLPSLTDQFTGPTPETSLIDAFSPGGEIRSMFEEQISATLEYWSSFEVMSDSELEQLGLTRGAVEAMGKTIFKSFSDELEAAKKSDVVMNYLVSQAAEWVESQKASSAWASFFNEVLMSINEPRRQAISQARDQYDAEVKALQIEHARNLEALTQDPAMATAFGSSDQVMRQRTIAEQQRHETAMADAKAKLDRKIASIGEPITLNQLSTADPKLTKAVRSLFLSVFSEIPTS